MNLRSLFAVAAIAAAALPAHAVTVVAWNFDTSTVSTTGTTLTGVAASTGAGSAGGMHASSSTAYALVGGNPSTGKALTSNNWAAGDYYQFNFSTTNSSGISISFDTMGSSTGPKDFALTYSTDGVNYTAYSTSSYTYNVAATFATTTFTLSALDNQSTVGIRLVDLDGSTVGGVAASTSGTSRIDNFTVTSTPPVPESETYAMLFAGLGAIGFIARRRKA